MRISAKYLSLVLAVGLIPAAGVAQAEAGLALAEQQGIESNWLAKLIRAAGAHDTVQVEQIVKSAEFNPSATFSKHNIPLVTMVYAASVVSGGDKSGQMLRIVLKAGAEPNAMDGRGNTPLHMAVGFKAIPPVRQLLDHGADPNIKNHAGVSPLDLATHLGRTRMVRILKQGGDAP